MCFSKSHHALNVATLTPIISANIERCRNLFNHFSILLTLTLTLSLTVNLSLTLTLPLTLKAHENTAEALAIINTLYRKGEVEVTIDRSALTQQLSMRSLNVEQVCSGLCP